MDVKQLFDMKDNVAVITGGGRGLGLIFARALAEAGSHVVLCSRKGGDCKEAAKKMEDLGVRAFGIKCDITNEENLLNVKAAVVAEFGRIDVLVNNAGATWGAPVADYPIEGWNKVLGVNVTGTFLASKIFGKTMIEQGTGKIINIGSVTSVVGSQPELMDSIAYNTSKGAILTFTKDLAVKWARFNVQVNAIGPGFFLTDMSKETIAQKSEKLLAHIPSNRFGSHDDLKGAVVFLASKASDYVTGTMLFVDGGYRAF